MYDALTDKAYFEPVFLNDLAPIEARDRYHFIQLLKMVCSLFQRLKLKDEPFSVFMSATSSEIDTLASFLSQIQPGIDPSSCVKSDLDRLPVLKHSSTTAA